MTSHILGHADGATDTALSAPVQIFDRIAARWAAYRVYQRTLGELNTLSDRNLADLGLHRSGLKAIAAEAAYQNTAV